MEQQNMNQSLFDLSFNENAKIQLKGAAVWGGIAAIIGLIGTLLSFGVVILEKINPSTPKGFEGFGEVRLTMEDSGTNLFSGIFSLAIGLLLFYLLIRFSNFTKTGLNGNNQELVNRGLGSLAAYFRTLGIILIIFIVFAVIGIAAAVGTSN